MSKKEKYLEDDSSEGEMGNLDMDGILNSEEEYSDGEKKLLEKARNKWQQENFDSEDEVMGFSDNEHEDSGDEDKDSMESDIENLKEDFDLPNEKAWGKKKKSYYSTDYVDADYASASQKDIADAEMEEQEARNLQEQLISQLDEADFGLDLISKVDISEYKEESEHIKADLSKLSKRQRKEILEKESPEFMPLVNDFQDRLTEIKTILGPYLNLVERHDCYNCPTTDFVKAKYNLLLHYCTNISFYLMLKAKREFTPTHPVIKRLAQYRQLLSQLENHQCNLLSEIKKILDANKNGLPLYKSKDLNDTNSKRKNMNDKNLLNKSKKLKTSDDKFSVDMLDQDSDMDEVENDEIANEDTETYDDDNKNGNEIENKRAITYQIAKNKGLTPHRKKEQRNPRVKHRNKYRKAIIRRRGAVREVRKETTRYAGEISGIKASVKKSIKLK